MTSLSLLLLLLPPPLLLMPLYRDRITLGREIGALEREVVCKWGGAYSDGYTVAPRKRATSRPARMPGPHPRGERDD
jgi:hypothetical protein